jgi:phage I-like protein
VSQLHEVSTKLAEANQKLADAERAAHAKRVDDLIDRAVRERRIPPSTKDFHRASCEAMGVEKYEAHLEKFAPQLQDDSTSDNAHAAETSADVLSQDEKDMAHKMGVTEAEYAAAKKGGV